MPRRVSPIETIRAEIDTVFGSGKPIEECLEELMRHSVRLVLQQVLEDEVTTWLGRDWNARGDRERAGQRNGHSDLTIKTTAGAVDLKRPKLRNTTEAYASQLFGKGVVRSAPLEALVISGWVRGLSDRDIEAMLGAENGLHASPRQRQILFMLAGRREAISRARMIAHLDVTPECFGTHLYLMRPNLWPHGLDIVYDKATRGYRLVDAGEIER